MKLSVAGRDGRYASKNGACQCFLIESEKGSKVVFDMGAGSLSKLWKYASPIEIDALFLSHLHFDHCSDALVYAQLLRYKNAPLKDLYLPSQPYEHVKLFEDCGAFRCHFYKDLTFPVTIGDIEVTAAEVEHPIKTFALSLRCDNKTLAYTADTVECEGLIEILKGADVVLADACISESEERDAKMPLPHITASRLAQLVDNKSLLLLTHLSDNKNLILQQTKRNHAFTVLARYKSYDIGT